MKEGQRIALKIWALERRIGVVVGWCAVMKKSPNHLALVDAVNPGSALHDAQMQFEGFSQ